MLGLLAWRDEVNKKGGLCVDNSCSQKMNISIVIGIPLPTVRTDSEFLAVARTYYNSIFLRDQSELPKALITPLGGKYANPVLSLFHENNIYMPVFSLTSEPRTVIITNSISILPSYTYDANSFVNILTNRYGIYYYIFYLDVKSVIVAGIGPQDEYLYKTADYISKIIKNRGINILGKKCSSTVNLYDGKDCESDIDCNSDEICKIPQIQNV